MVEHVALKEFVKYVHIHVHVTLCVLTAVRQQGKLLKTSVVTCTYVAGQHTHLQSTCTLAY